MANLEYVISIIPLSEDDGGGYGALIADLQGLLADGDTPQEALENLLDAYVEWMACNAERGRPAPEVGNHFAANEEQERNILGLNEDLRELVGKQTAVIQAQAAQIAELNRELQVLRHAATITTQGHTFVVQGSMTIEPGWVSAGPVRTRAFAGGGIEHLPSPPSRLVPLVRVPRPER